MTGSIVPKKIAAALCTFTLVENRCVSRCNSLEQGAATLAAPRGGRLRPSFAALVATSAGAKWRRNLVKSHRALFPLKARQGLDVR